MFKTPPFECHRCPPFEYHVVGVIACFVGFASLIRNSGETLVLLGQILYMRLKNERDGYDLACVINVLNSRVALL